MNTGKRKYRELSDETKTKISDATRVKERRPPQLQDLRDSGSIEQDATLTSGSARIDTATEERILQKRMKQYRYESVSDFIRAAALDDHIKVVTEVHQDPIRKDYTELIKSTVECIRTLEFRMNRAQGDFQKAIKCPGADHYLINRHATRFRLITATLGNRMNELITLLGEGHEKDGWR